MNDNKPSTQEGDTPNRKLIALAWIPILIICIPQLIYRQFVQLAPGEPVKPMWLALVEIALLAVLWLVSWIWSALKSLRGFILALLTYSAWIFLILPLIVYSAAWSNWEQQLSQGVSLVVTRLVVHLVPVVLMALTLIGSGIGRQELFLVRGNPSALGQPSHLLFQKEPKPWTRSIREFLPVFIIISVVVLGIQVRPTVSKISQALIYLPAIIIASAINAFAEEFEFRSVLLARLLPFLGKQQSIMITSLFFGLVHYFGSPSGIAGALMSTYLGYISAKSIVETRGFVWAFLIHFIGDFIIYTFWTMAV